MGKAKTALIIAAVVLIIPLALAVVITIVNDNTAADLEKQLAEIPLPDGMTCVESFSAAGKNSRQRQRYAVSGGYADNG